MSPVATGIRWQFSSRLATEHVGNEEAEEFERLHIHPQQSQISQHKLQSKQDNNSRNDSDASKTAAKDRHTSRQTISMARSCPLHFERCSHTKARTANSSS